MTKLLSKREIETALRREYERLPEELRESLTFEMYYREAFTTDVRNGAEFTMLRRKPGSQ